MKKYFALSREIHLHHPQPRAYSCALRLGIQSVATTMPPSYLVRYVTFGLAILVSFVPEFAATSGTLAFRRHRVGVHFVPINHESCLQLLFFIL